MSKNLIINCISDTHGRHRQITLPGGDILIHAGDCTLGSELEDALEFLDWYEGQNYSHRILIAGNNDYIFELIPELMEEECKKRQIHLLNDSGCEIEDIKIWGSPIQPTFCDMAFNRDRGADIKKHWDLIPKETEILITHGPPYGIRDEVGEKHLGCEDLLQKILQIHLKLHVFGHIHPGAGVAQRDGRTFINAASINKSPGYTRVIKEAGCYKLDQGEK